MIFHSFTFSTFPPGVSFQIKRSDSAFFWEEREIMINSNSEWIVKVNKRLFIYLLIKEFFYKL